MIDRLMPIFAVIGVISSFGYLSLMIWAMYKNLNYGKKNSFLPTQVNRT